MAKAPICPTCGKSCANVRKGLICASKPLGTNIPANHEYLKAIRTKRTSKVERGWIHVHAGLPYSRLFPNKAECLADIAWKSNNSPLSRARRATITTTITWK